MNVSAIKDFHYELHLKLLLKIAPAFGREFYNFQRSLAVEILNCKSYHTITYLLYDWKIKNVRRLICTEGGKKQTKTIFLIGALSANHNEVILSFIQSFVSSNN